MRRQRAALQVLPEGKLAEQAAQTLVISQLPTLAPSPPHCAEQELHKLLPRWRAERKAVLWSQEDKMLGFLESISNSDSDSLLGCLIHLLPPYSCNFTGKSHCSEGFSKDLLAAPYKNLGRRAGSLFLPPVANVGPPQKESSV